MFKIVEFIQKEKSYLLSIANEKVINYENYEVLELFFQAKGADINASTIIYLNIIIMIFLVRKFKLSKEN